MRVFIAEKKQNNFKAKCIPHPTYLASESVTEKSYSKKGIKDFLGMAESSVKIF